MVWQLLMVNVLMLLEDFRSVFGFESWIMRLTMLMGLVIFVYVIGTYTSLKQLHQTYLPRGIGRWRTYDWPVEKYNRSGLIPCGIHPTFSNLSQTIIINFPNNYYYFFFKKKSKTITPSVLYLKWYLLFDAHFNIEVV